MPGKVKVKILAGRNLPVMDRAGDTTDAFVEIKFGGVTHKTDICKKSLNPHWNSAEWYRFEVDESELQDEPLQLRLLDHDTYSANDTIGKIVISLSPLISRDPSCHSKFSSTGTVMSGWVPVFDTMHGMRGELNIIVKVELFSDYNKYKTSSCGVQFFHCSIIPPGYRVITIHGFVEELVVNDDPEYQWIDKIRTPRASNEARQAAFIKLSNQAQRLVGVKAADLGANAVLAYHQAFDMEGEAGVVARATGTAVTIEKIPVTLQPVHMPVCNQHQLKKYLDVLTTDNESITDLNEYFQTHHEELDKLMHILHPKLSPNLLDECENDDDSLKFSVKTDSLSQEEYELNVKHVLDDQKYLNSYLYCNDRDVEEADTVKRIRKSNFFSRRFGSRYPKRLEKDSISIKSNSSDASRISLAELKKEFKKFKRLRKPKFRNAKSNEEGLGMASILARSVIHAHSSLARIVETQDSEHSPCSTLRRTSESEPAVNKSNNEIIEPIIPITVEEVTNVNARSEQPQAQFRSLRNVSKDESNGLHRRLSISCPSTPCLNRKNLLKLPGEEGYYGSLSSALSGESSDIYSSSEDDDDESSDLKTESEKFMEAPSVVAQSVLNQGLNEVEISQIEKKLDEIECKDIVIENDEIMPKHSSEGDLRVMVEKSNVDQRLKLPEDNSDAGPCTAPISTNSHHHYFKFHNPFVHKKASLSEPSSPTDKKSNIVYRSSKHLKGQFAKLTKSNMMKSLSHYSLLPKKNKLDTKPNHHSSATEIGPKGHSRETVLGSPFMSYSDLLSLDKEYGFKRPVLNNDDSKVHMYIGSEPVSCMSSSSPSSPKSSDFIGHETKSHAKDKSAIKRTGLLHTAMETILLDKVEALLIPTSPDVANKEEQKFFDDVNEQLGKVEEMRNKELENADTVKDNKKLVKQISIHSSFEDIAPKSVFNEKKAKPMLQHFHPIMSGPIYPKPSHLETIPSLPETSFDREFSIDSQSEIDSTQSLCENIVPKTELPNNDVSVVCDNTHAVCGGYFPRDKAKENNSPRRHRHESGPSGSTSNHAHTAPIGILRRSSDSDVSVTPKGSHPSGGSILKSSMHPNNIDMLEYPFLTLTEYPVGFVLHIAGSVFARSVKLIDGAADVATRTAWWTELRTELRSHARALKCNSVITYSEDASICEDVCILSVSGTAAIINLECDFSAEPNLNEDSTSCSITHLNSNSPQYSRTLCGICGVRPVSSVLLATCAIPPHVATAAVANTISAAATRARRTSPQGEAGARDLSDQLPFLEYELHKLLLAKLRMQGANSIFNLETQITIGERYVSALATGTAVRLLALPGPSPPIVKAPEGDKVAAELQKALLDNFTINKVASGYDVATTETKVNGVIQEQEKVEIAPLDLCSDKDACVLEIDETEDVETAKALCIRRRPLPVLTVHPDVKFKPNANPQAFVQVWRGKYVGGTPMAEKHVSRVLDGVYYKLRTMKPCCITPVRFQLDYVDEDIQLLISGAAIPLIDPYGGPENGTRVKKISSISQSITKNMSRINRHQIKRRADDDIIFNFDYDKLLPPLPEKKRQTSELKERPPKVRQAQIALTPLPFIHGATKQTWICALRLLFVRETTSVKELGGLNGFLHSTMSEVLAIVRAYTAALGGNTLASFYITQLMIQDNAHKNQGQCLLSVGGDVMHVTY